MRVDRGETREPLFPSEHPPNNHHYCPHSFIYLSPCFVDGAWLIWNQDSSWQLTVGWTHHHVGVNCDIASVLRYMCADPISVLWGCFFLFSVRLSSSDMLAYCFVVTRVWLYSPLLVLRIRAISGIFMAQYQHYKAQSFSSLFIYSSSPLHKGWGRISSHSFKTL